METVETQAFWLQSSCNSPPHLSASFLSESYSKKPLLPYLTQVPCPPRSLVWLPQLDTHSPLNSLSPALFLNLSHDFDRILPFPILLRIEPLSNRTSFSSRKAQCNALLVGHTQCTSAEWREFACRLQGPSLQLLCLCFALGGWQKASWSTNPADWLTKELRCLSRMVFWVVFCLSHAKGFFMFFGIKFLNTEAKNFSFH